MDCMDARRVSDVFISYASADRPRIMPLVEALRKKGWSVWWDRTIPPGKTWDQVIEAALDAARCMIVVWSKESVKAHWVLTEAEEGRRREILIPARIDDVVIPLAFRRLQVADLVGWSGTLPNGGFDELAGAVSGVLGDAAKPAANAAQTGVRLNPIDGLNYVFIPPGKFTMGCSVGDSECFSNESPPHDVRISKGFWLGQTQVTQAACKEVMKSNPSRFKDDELAVENVTWHDAVKYCETVGGRLPTEAEWEYAARAGSNAARYGDVDAIAWYGKNSGSTSHAVGGKQPNQFGLFDMLGNVWEWVQDDYAP
jgi:formylglycine-generating enzyme required for sulfatase activity